jgi:hypothetical protein
MSYGGTKNPHLGTEEIIHEYSKWLCNLASATNLAIGKDGQHRIEFRGESRLDQGVAQQERQSSTQTDLATYGP